MIHQALADALEPHQDRDAHVPEVTDRTDASAQQMRRRMDRAAGEHDFAAAELTRRTGKIIKRSKNLKALDTRRRHKLRIAIKKVRYACEFFESVYEGRKIERRRPYELQFERVLEAVVATGTMLEINAAPDRRDMDDVHARAAAAAGIPVVINCDAHRVGGFEVARYGIATARRAGIPIFFCTQETRPNNRPAGAVSTRRKREVPADGYAIYHEFKVEPDDIVILKQRASIFQGTPLSSHLSLLGIQSLIVCGESTSGCVRASVVDGYSCGLHVSVVEECTYDRAELTHKINLFDMHHKYADVMHIDEVLAHLDAMSVRRAAE